MDLKNGEVKDKAFAKGEPCWIFLVNLAHDGLMCHFRS